MATYLDGYINGLKAEQPQLRANFIALLIQRTEEVKKMIKDRWLLGKKPDGSLIGFYRDVDYAIFKQQINSLAGGDVDLTLTGSLGDRIKLFPDNKGVEIYSDDWKFEQISLKYGIDNFNVTDDEENKLLDEIAGQLINNIFKKIWG